MTTKTWPAAELAVLDSVGVAIVACDMLGTIALWNRAAEDRFG